MTRAEALRLAIARLRDAGLDERAADDARQLLAKASGLSRTALITDMGQEQPPEEVARFETLVTRREAREPLSHILGSVGFWTLELEVNGDVLTPRADTETVIEAALDTFLDRSAPLNILDIGTGSGAIALALLSEFPSARAIATDLSESALAVAARNAQRNGLAERLTLVKTHWTDGLDGSFDLIVSNPPYIATSVIDTLEPEVKRFEPRLALDGGVEGLDPYGHLIGEAKRLLSPRGVAVFEIGFDQGAALQHKVEAAGARGEILQDLAGLDRVVRFQFAP